MKNNLFKLLFGVFAFFIWSNATGLQAQSNITLFNEILNETYTQPRLLNITGNNTKHRSTYTVHGIGFLRKDRNRRTIEGIVGEAAFSDRNNFSGKKDRQTLLLSTQGNNVRVQIRLDSWGRGLETLSNVRIHKEKFGYFITGEYQTTHYIIAIYPYQ